MTAKLQECFGMGLLKSGALSRLRSGCFCPQVSEDVGTLRREIGPTEALVCGFSMMFQGFLIGVSGAWFSKTSICFGGFRIPLTRLSDE